MALDHFLEFAIERRERARQNRRSGDQRRPIAAAKAVQTLEVVTAGETIRELMLLCRQEVDRKMPIALKKRQDGRFTVDAGQEIVGGSSDSDVTDVAVMPAHSLSFPAVTIPTPAASCRIASRNAFGSGEMEPPQTAQAQSSFLSSRSNRNAIRSAASSCS